MSEELIKRLMETGDIKLGSDVTIKSMKNGSAKAVILSVNCPKDKANEIKKLSEENKIRVYVYPGTSLELGEACGKPFPVSAIAVKNQGDADISQLEVSK